MAAGVHHHRARAPEAIEGFEVVRLELLVPPHLEELAIRIELLDAMVPRVGHVHRSVRADGDAPRLLERAGRAGPSRHISERSPREEQLPVRVELLNPVVARVGHVDRAIRPGGDTARRIELAGGLARPAPHRSRGDLLLPLRAWVFGGALPADSRRPHAVRPDLRGDVLADVQAHPLGDRPLRQIKILRRILQLAVEGVVAIPPDIPQSLAHLGIRQVLLDIGPFQIEVVLHGPDHADVLEFVVAAPEQHLHPAPVRRASDDDRGIKRLARGLLAEVRLVLVVAQIPRHRPRHRVVVGDLQAVPVLRALGDFIHLRDHGFDAARAVGVDEELVGVVVVHVRGDEGCPRGEQGQQAEAGQHGEAEDVAPLQVTAQEVDRRAADERRQ